MKPDEIRRAARAAAIKRQRQHRLDSQGCLALLRCRLCGGALTYLGAGRLAPFKCRACGEEQQA